MALNWQHPKVRAVETFVLSGTAPKNFAHKYIAPGSITVTSRHPEGSIYSYTSPNKTYVEGTDYVIDYVNGTIARKAGSTIPDWSVKPPATKASFGAETKNDEYLIWVENKWQGIAYKAPQNRSLSRLSNKMKIGTALNICILGDSISTGSEAELVAHRYFEVWAQNIRNKFPKLAVAINNQAVGGTTSVDLTDTTKMAQRVTGNPDLVIIAYGMNDQSSPRTPDTFESYLRSGVNWIQVNFPNADILLVSGCRGNYETFYDATSDSYFREYILRMDEISKDTANVGFANITARWDSYLQRKTFHDLLRNDINHPTSFGHRVIYPEVLNAFIS